MTRVWVLPVVIAAMMASLVAILGTTITEIGPWYHSLTKPSWAPPDAAYGVAWTAIYACTALAGVAGWLALSSWRAREWLFGLFCFNGFLNIMWSLLFFRMHRPDWAATEVWGLWLSIAVLIAATWRHSRLSALLLLPYLAWVGFAGFLNVTIVHLNGPFS